MELEAPVPKGQATGRTTRAVEQHMGALKGIDAAQQHAVSLQQSLLQDRALKMSEVTQLATERVLSMPNNTLHPSTRAAMARDQARLAAAREKSAQQQLAAATHRSSGGGGAAAGAAADAWQTVTSPLRRMPPATAPGAGGGSSATAWQTQLLVLLQLQLVTAISKRPMRYTLPRLRGTSSRSRCQTRGAGRGRSATRSRAKRGGSNDSAGSSG